jgi:hypothetical protein
VLTQSEIVAMAERCCKARDHDPADARAMLNQFAHDHDRDATVAVIAAMKQQTQARYDAVIEVYKDLPHTLPFAEALRIKTERNDPCANGWHRMNDGTYYRDIVIDRDG